MKNKITFCLKLILLLLICAWIFSTVNINESIKVLSKANLKYFFIAFIFNNLSCIMLTIKWFRLSQPLGIQSNFFDLLGLNYISLFYSIFLPGQGSGELIKGLRLKSKESSHQKVWIPIFIDKTTNLLIMMLIGFIAILMDANLKNNWQLIFSVLLLTLAFSAFTIILFSKHSEKIGDFIKKIIIKTLALIKIESKTVNNFSINYFEEYKKNDLIMLETIVWSFFTKLPHIFAIYFLGKSLNLDINFVQSAWLYSIVCIATLLPISFSGLGVREGTLIILLSKIGIQKYTALGFSVLVFTNGLIVGLIGGILEFVYLLKIQKK